MGSLGNGNGDKEGDGKGRQHHRQWLQQRGWWALESSNNGDGDGEREFLRDPRDVIRISQQKPWPRRSTARLPCFESDLRTNAGGITLRHRKGQKLMR
jgi:hypothetical protein